LAGGPIPTDPDRSRPDYPEAPRAQVLAALAQAEASQAMMEVLGRIADALERAHPAPASGPSALISRMVPRSGPPREKTPPVAHPQPGQ
jgi:hypothetical protein